LFGHRHVDLAEPVVALTDLLLAVECGIFAHLLRRRGRQPLGDCFLGIFACIGLASLLGGIVHGFFTARDSLGHRLLWPTTLVALVAMASLLWLAGAQLLLPVARRRSITAFAVALFATATAFVVFVEASFWVVVVTYFPSVIWLAAGYVVAMRRQRDRGLLVTGVVGLGLTLVAAGIQQGGVALHPRYFDHNALYHVVQAVALWLVFVSTRGLPTMSAAKAGGS